MDPIVQLSLVFVLGIGAQWVAWRLRLPAILLLLVAGLFAGPIIATQFVPGDRWLDPSDLFGEMLLPAVSLAVAVILFEGGLTLSFRDLKQGSDAVIRNLVTIGALGTGVLAALAAWATLGLDLDLAILLGGILTVTGPTVIGPLLRHVKPTGRIGNVVKWEGIVIDPIGAMLAVLVFEVIISTGDNLWYTIPVVLIKTVAIGTAFGFLGAVLMIVMYRRYWVPDYLQSPVTLMVVIAVYLLCDKVQHESGLFGVTIAGVIMANQRYVTMSHILEFKENLRVLLISALFILLASRLTVEQLEAVSWSHLLFIVLLIVVVRPLSVIASTWRSGLSWREKAFISWMAPRGVVAAAVASVFALRLMDQTAADADQERIEQIQRLVPATFAVIVGTVAFYGLTAAPVARWLKLARPGKLGFLIAGANPLARLIGGELQKRGLEVLLVDTSRPNVQAARDQGLDVYYGSINSRQVLERIELSGIGRLLALTPSDEVNSLAVLHYLRHFERQNVYQLVAAAPEGSRRERVSQEMRGRTLIGKTFTYGELMRRVSGGGRVGSINLQEEPDAADLVALAKDGQAPLFLQSAGGAISVVTAEDAAVQQKQNQTLILLQKPGAESSPPEPKREQPDEAVSD